MIGFLRHRGGSLKRRGGLLAGGVVVAGGLAYLFSGAIADALTWDLTPSELIARGDEIYGKSVRLGGLVAENSVDWDAEALDLRFRIEDPDGAAIDVHWDRHPASQMFREGIGAVVEGRMTEGGVFEATNVIVRHSNEYRAPHEGQDPREMYRTLMQDEG